MCFWCSSFLIILSLDQPTPLTHAQSIIGFVFKTIVSDASCNIFWLNLANVPFKYMKSKYFNSLGSHRRERCMNISLLSLDFCYISRTYPTKLTAISKHIVGPYFPILSAVLRAPLQKRFLSRFPWANWGDKADIQWINKWIKGTERNGAVCWKSEIWIEL